MNLAADSTKKETQRAQSKTPCYLWFCLTLPEIIGAGCSLSPHPPFRHLLLKEKDNGYMSYGEGGRAEDHQSSPVITYHFTVLFFKHSCKEDVEEQMFTHVIMYRFFSLEIYPFPFSFRRRCPQGG